MYPNRPDLIDAETVLAVHVLSMAANLPPTYREVGGALGMACNQAEYRIGRAYLHGWLVRLPRGWRCYVTPWYTRRWAES